jgi:hypothetical protein
LDGAWFESLWGKRFFLFTTKKVPNGSWVHPVSYSMVIGVLSPGLKRPERGVNHSLSYSTKVKNEWSYASTSPIYIHGVGKENFNCIPFISSWVFGFYFMLLYFA